MRNNDSSRTKNAFLNVGITFLGQFSQIILGFIIRKLFILYLGVEYLGYNSVFQNILQMLNLADLGIGVAITSFLYKPLAIKDKKTVASLMRLYKRIYSILGIFVLVIGILFSFIIQFIITDAAFGIGYLRLIFYINLASAVSTYFLAYKRTLLIADQKSYVAVIIDTVSYIVMSLIQIGILVIYPNYISFILVTFLKNVLSNIIISLRCNQILGEYTLNYDQKVIKEYNPLIFSYIKDVFISRIGAYVYYSTDNIIISVFRGSLLAGYLSNYTLVITQVNYVVTQMLSSVQATFGNYINSNGDIYKQKQMTNNFLFFNYCIGNFCMLCIMFLIQPFIELFFGSNFILDFSTAVLLAVNLLLTILIQIPSQVFMIYKLYHYDRPIIIISAFTNIIISSLLVKKLGVNGVLIGTFITSLFYLFSRFYIISKRVYFIPYCSYVLTFLKYGLTSIIAVIAEILVVRNINGITTIIFLFKMILVTVIAVVIPVICLAGTREIKFFMQKVVPYKWKKLINSKSVIAVCLLLTVICLSVGSLVNIPEINSAKGNKSLPRNEVYRIDERSTDSRFFHLSFDDVINIFKDLTVNEDYQSIFDNNNLEWFKKLHDKYGVVISCYVFYEADGISLGQCTERFKDEFEENANWLRFGFHSINDDTTYGKNKGSITKDYNLTIAALKKIVGEKAIDHVIRLQSYQASSNEIQSLLEIKEEPPIGFLTADDLRNSYALKDEENTYIYSHDVLEVDGIYYYSTDLRAEYIEDIDNKLKELDTPSWNNQLGCLEIFTHEWAINKQIKTTIEKVCEWSSARSYGYLFWEDMDIENDVWGRHK